MKKFMNIQEIQEFRRSKKGTCLSTTHTMSAEDFTTMLPRLLRLYVDFDVSYAKEWDKPIKLTIPMNQNKI